MKTHTGLSLLFAPLLLLSSSLQTVEAQPTVLDPNIDVRSVVTVPGTAVRVVEDRLSDDLFVMRTSGEIYRVDVAGGSRVLAYDAQDHGLPTNNVLGLASGPDGSLYVVGNIIAGTTVFGRVMRGTPTGGGGGASRTWTVLVESESHLRSATAFDHFFNGAVVSPDGTHLFLNSGSRTDHGEIQNQNGAIADLREEPITSAILRIPLDAAATIILKNDVDSLAAGGYVFADGVRNAFDLAFYNDWLFGTENSGDRDDGDELNWLREGEHYGFPWRMGNNDTPMQFAGYNPANDELLNPSATAVQGGFFYDDPAYPPAPAGVSFVDPIPNVGPDANFYRDPTSGAIVDADDAGTSVYSFTAHRSPLGLVFDNSRALAAPYRDAGFVFSWTGTSSGLLGPFGDSGEDLLQLSLFYSTGGALGIDSMMVEQIATGFDHPIDAVMRDDKLFVIEMSGTLWELTFPADAGTGTYGESGPKTRLAVHIESLYPNPARDALRFVVRSPAGEQPVVEVVDMLGREVRAAHTLSSPSSGTTGDSRVEGDVGLSGLATGLYVLRATTSATVAYRAFLVTG